MVEEEGGDGRVVLVAGDDERREAPIFGPVGVDAGGGEELRHHLGVALLGGYVERRAAVV